LAGVPKAVLRKNPKSGKLRQRELAFRSQRMNEIIFLVEEAVEGGFTARALGQSIFTEAETLEGLRQQVRDAVNCHFDAENAPKVIRLHFVREEVLAG
jgi:hypothetical protein